MPPEDPSEVIFHKQILAIGPTGGYRSYEFHSTCNTVHIYLAPSFHLQDPSLGVPPLQSFSTSLLRFSGRHLKASSVPWIQSILESGQAILMCIINQELRHWMEEY